MSTSHNNAVWQAGADLAMVKMAYGMEDYERNVLKPQKTSLEKMIEARKGVAGEYAGAKDARDEAARRYEQARKERDEFFGKNIYSGKIGWRHPINSIKYGLKNLWYGRDMDKLVDAANQAGRQKTDTADKVQKMEDQAKAENINLRTGQYQPPTAGRTIMIRRNYTTGHRPDPYAARPQQTTQTITFGQQAPSPYAQPSNPAVATSQIGHNNWQPYQPGQQMQSGVKTASASLYGALMTKYAGEDVYDDNDNSAEARWFRIDRPDGSSPASRAAKERESRAAVKRPVAPAKKPVAKPVARPAQKQPAPQVKRPIQKRPGLR